MLLVGNHSGGNLTPDTGVFTLAFSTYFGASGLYQLAHNLVLSIPGCRSCASTARSRRRTRTPSKALPGRRRRARLPIPFVVGDVFEARVVCDARVVHQDVEAAEGAAASSTVRSGSPRCDRSALDVHHLADLRRLAPPTGDDACALVRELPRHLDSDPTGRAGDQAGAVGESQIHGG